MINSFKVHCISEVENGIMLDIILCDFGINKNGKILDRENADENVQTMINQPLVAKISENKDGDDDFTGHNRKVAYSRVNGSIQAKTYLDTNAYGVCVEASIQEIDGGEYVTGKFLVWDRYENCVNIIKERFESSEGLYGSWELLKNASEQVIIDGQSAEKITDWEFIGFCLLGKYVSPAYDSARVLNVAEEEIDDFEESLSEAFNKDIEKGGLEMEEEKNEVLETEVSTEETVEPTVEAQEEVPTDETPQEEVSEEVEEKDSEEVSEEVEVSALSMNDIYRKLSDLSEKICEGEEDCWYYLSHIYPNEKVAYYKKYWGEELDSEFTQVNYDVVGNDISVVSTQKVEMVFVPKSDVEESAKIEEVKNELSEKINEIVNLGNIIAEKDTLISEKENLIAELEVSKKELDEIKKKEEEEESAKKKRMCSEMVSSCKFITEVSEELQKAIDEANETQVKVFIAEAVIEYSKANAKADVEVSENNALENASVNIDNEPHKYNGGSINALQAAIKSKRKKY